MASYADAYGYGSGYGSYPAMDGNSAYPAVDGNSTGYPGSSGYEDDSILDAQYRSGGRDVKASLTSVSPPNVDRSLIYGPLSPRALGDAENPVHNITSRSKHTRSAPRPTKDGLFHCLYEGCDYLTKRQYDVERHQRHHQQHHDPPEKFDCLGRGCGRTGDYGFDRKDHLREHMRKVHAKDMPKGPTKQKAFDCPESGCDRRGTYAFRSKLDLKDHLRREHGEIVPTISIKQGLFDCPEDGCRRTGRRAFARRDSLKAHLRRIHKKIVPTDSIRLREELEDA